jgi:glutamine synthetase
MRMSIASAGNDHRLGVSEAPPAIISTFLGEELTDILATITTGKSSSKNAKANMNIGASVLPSFPKDTTDRNRTSPFAFTGNKFEFRMVGSSDSIAAALFVINTIVADALSEFADKLEKAKDFNKTLNDLIKSTVKKHERIIFNGNNYSDEWVSEAKKRGLLNLKTTVDALASFDRKENIALFEKHGVLSKVEVKSRKEVLLENYWKIINIEALTMRNLTRKEYLPTVSDYAGEITRNLESKVNAEKNLKIKNTGKVLEEAIMNRLGPLTESLYKEIENLEKTLYGSPSTEDANASAKYYVKKVLPAMQKLRDTVDELELVVGKDYWPVPSYGEILYSVK